MTCARRPAEARTPASPTSAEPVPGSSKGSPRRPDARTGRPRARRLCLLLPVLALLFGALCPFPPAQAEDHTVTIWSATLTPAATVPGVSVGCDYANSNSADHCTNVSVLSDDEFTYDGTVYRIIAITFIPSGNTLSIEVSADSIPQALQDSGTFHVGDTSLALSGTSARSLVQTNSAPAGLMTAGTPVTVSISILKPGHRPAAPTNLGVSASNAQLDLTWNASVGATGYEVHYTSLSAGYAPDTWPALDESEFYRYRPGNGWVALPHTGTTASQTISGLTNGTAYRLRVRAKNAAGVSDWVVVNGTPGGTPPATMSFAVSTLRVVEGNPVPDLEVKLSRPLTQALSIPITTKRGSAEVGDYVRQQNSVTIPAGETSASFTSWARAAQDDDKDNETVTVSLPPDGLSGRVVAGNPSSVTVTIVDDDVGGGIVNVSFAEAAMELCEGGPQKYLPELMLSRRPDRSTTIWLTGDRGTAEPNDHTFLYVGYIGIQRIPHAWHASPYAIRALQDAGKAFEQFTVEIDESRLPDGFWAVEPKKVTVTIIDDDLWRQDGCNIQPPRLSVKGDRGVEWSGGGWIDFTVSIDRDNREPFTVEYSTEDVTAVTGQDYTAKTGTLSFGPYQRSQEVRVHILDDDVEDSGETFRLVLSNPNGAVIENGVGIGTILNDDGGEVQLTAAFEHAPARHDGSAFWFDLRFNEPLGATANAPSAASFTVKNGSIDRVWKVEAGRWRLQVAPETRHDVTVTLAGGRACDAAGTVCTVDGRALSNSPTATVAGPDGVLSADANLSGLTAEAGADGSWTALDVGTFAAATTAYTASVENATTHVAPNGDGGGHEGDAEGGRGDEPRGGELRYGERRDRARVGRQRAQGRGDRRGRHGQDVHGDGDAAGGPRGRRGVALGHPEPGGPGLSRHGDGDAGKGAVRGGDGSSDRDPGHVGGRGPRVSGVDRGSRRRRVRHGHDNDVRGRRRG